MNRSFNFWILVAVVALALGVAACGSVDSQTDDQGTTGSSGLSAKTQKAIDEAYEGSFGELPASSPKPEPGKNVWFITVDRRVVDYTAPGQILDGAELMGWDMTMCDGEYNFDKMVTCLRQAIADKADGIIGYVTDCAPLKAAFQEADRKDIPVVTFEAIDCDLEVDQSGEITETGEPRLFDAQVMYNNPENPDEPNAYPELYGETFAKFQALGLIDGTEGKAKIIKLKETDVGATLLQDRGFQTTIDEYCPECEVVETVELIGADIGPPLQEKVEQAIARNPDANAIFGVYDAITENVAAAVLASGREDEIFVVGGEGIPSVVDLIAAERGVDAGVGFPVRWEAWAGLDTLNRLFHGEEPTHGFGFPSGFGVQLYDKEHNMPPEGTRFEGPVDFEKAYREAWGVE